VTYVISTDDAKLMKHRIASSVCSSSMPMDKLGYLLRTKGVKVEDTRMVPAKGPLMLKLDNPFFSTKESILDAVILDVHEISFLS